MGDRGFRRRNRCWFSRDRLGQCRRSLCRKSLLWCHGASLGPCGCEGVLSERDACGSHRTLVGSTIDWRDRWSSTLAPGLFFSPNPCRPYLLPPPHEHRPPTFHACAHEPPSSFFSCLPHPLPDQATCRFL